MNFPGDSHEISKARWKHRQQMKVVSSRSSVTIHADLVPKRIQTQGRMCVHTGVYCASHNLSVTSTSRNQTHARHVRLHLDATCNIGFAALSQFIAPWTKTVRKLQHVKISGDVSLEYRTRNLDLFQTDAQRTAKKKRAAKWSYIESVASPSSKDHRRYRKWKSPYGKIERSSSQ